MRSLFVALLVLPIACKRPEEKTPAAIATPVLWSERGTVLECIDAQRLTEAAETLKNAPDTADVHYLRAKLAMATNDAETAYRELTKAVALAPGWPEYQYELGTVAPLPVQGISMEETKARHVAAGKALARAVELKPDEPRYLYARAFFLSVEPPETGGDPSAGEKIFERIVERHPESMWAHRVLFDRAARAEEWSECEEHAKRVAEKDGKEGARLWLQLAGTHLARTTRNNEEEQLAKTRNALESAAKSHPPAANGFCDAGEALDGGGNRSLAHPFWKRCLELDPNGPKAEKARVRVLGGKMLKIE